MMKGILLRLMCLFPAPFRERFGDEIVHQVTTDLENARTRGRIAALTFTCSASLGLLRSALAEHSNPTWSTRPVRASGRNKETRTMLDAWTSDFRFALRALRRSPGFTLATVLTLGLAIGVNAGIFTVVDQVLLDPLPYRDNERLVTLAASAPGTDMPPEFRLAGEFYLHFRENAESLVGVANFNSFTNTLRAEGRVERVRMSAPSPEVFELLGVDPMMGRVFAADDEQDVVVISHSLWTSWLGSDPDVLGRVIDVGGANRTVIGVMGPDFWFPRNGTLLWFPNGYDIEDVDPGQFNWLLLGRMAPGATEEQVAEELRTLSQQLPDRFGGSANYTNVIENIRIHVRPLEDEFLADVSGPLWILLAAVGVVLLIACANVGNLLMVRTERRHGELALQQAIGANRIQLVRSQLAEALLLSLAGGAVAVLLAGVTVPLLVQSAPDWIPRLGDVELGARTLLFTFALSIVAGLMCGLLPALKGSKPDLGRLREGGRGLTRHWGRNGLVVVQTALALVLLIASGLLLRSFLELRKVDPGYSIEDIYTFQMAPEGEHLDSAAAFARFHTDFKDHIAALPGVESVGLVENLPLNEGVSSLRFLVEGAAPDAVGVPISYTWSDGDYFPTAGIDLLAGRVFTEADHTTDRGNVILSRAAADQLFPDQNPLGKRLRTSSGETWYTVAGVVEDVLQYNFRDDPLAMAYLPLVGPNEDSWWITSPAYVVKTARAEEIGPEIRALIREHAPSAPMYRTFTMEGLAADSMLGLSFSMITLAFAAGLALLLGAIGLYGVLSYVVAERTREIGLRMAMGAAPRRVQLMVVGQAFRVVAVGLALGLVASAAATRTLSGMLYGVEAVDASTFLSMSLAMALVGLLATWMPARRASAVDPMVSLRAD